MSDIDDLLEEVNNLPNLADRIIDGPLRPEDLGHLEKRPTKTFVVWKGEKPWQSHMVRIELYSIGQSLTQFLCIAWHFYVGNKMNPRRHYHISTPFALFHQTNCTREFTVQFLRYFRITYQTMG